MPVRLHRLSLVMSVAAFALLGAAPRSGAEVDPALVYEERCARCHGGAAKLVDQTLTVNGETIVLKVDGIELRTFLERHGGLRGDEIASMTSFLRAKMTESLGRRVP